ncbi:MAG TPA: DUF502 domain-containing protein [Geminicoccus sp.]|uniref:DUF502 domain-containing protein n=1 Tax=Geminicoccus sp. TaxID=2024832 RepID=UPI002B6ADBA8|nr:DUF502 domain-containing protein [Geminicoccus sp.]HWL67600.1 DUF502 domain-containing protein [Geminicoccus sp.]
MHLPRQPLGARIRNWLLAGMIVTAPLLITAYVVWQVVDFFDGWMNSILPARWNPETYLPFSLPGVGLLMAMAILVLIGWSTAGLIGRTLVSWSELLLARMPVIRSIYATLKQLFETLFAQQAKAFRDVVMVEFPTAGQWSVGFMTGEAPDAVGDQVEGPHVSVFVPLTPNPTSGFIIFVPRSRIRVLDITVDEAFKMILSFGIVGGTRSGLSQPSAPVEQPQGIRAPEQV